MPTRLDQLPAVLTSFAYREEYFPELDGMIKTIREHHPTWYLVTGRGPAPGFHTPTLEVESPRGKCHWSLPIVVPPGGGESDWRNVVLMKGWWMARVWHEFGVLAGPGLNRVVWLDADGRLNGPLDIELESTAETFASPWWTDPGTPASEHHVCSGMLVFQGAGGGVVQSILDQWSARCIGAIQSPPVASPYGPWNEGDQDVLTKVLHEAPVANASYRLVKLAYEKYCGVPDYKTGKPKAGALVDQWMMGEKMRLPEDRDRNWPPPESMRRPSGSGTTQ